jgi:hypothetical protein
MIYYFVIYNCEIMYFDDEYDDNNESFNLESWMLIKLRNVL